MTRYAIVQEVGSNGYEPLPCGRLESPDLPKPITIQGPGYRIRCAQVEFQGSKEIVAPRGWEAPSWAGWMVAVWVTAAFWVILGYAVLRIVRGEG